jgi:DNA polymerase
VTLVTIASEIAACHACRLCEKRTNVVPGEGVERPLVFVVGEGPGADEDASGRPFVGKAGQLLDKMLAAIQLSRETNCFIGNVVKCRPPGNRDPQPDERDACMPFLRRQIALLRPAFLLCMGRTAAQAMLNTDEGITRLRGKFYQYKVDDSLEIPMMVTFHPSYLLRDPNQKRWAWEDLKLLRARLSAR